ncbi:MAG: helix-turn-helix domain-containing protein [Myxococcota bacterium]
MSQGFYEMLGVDRSASPEEIRRAFQTRLASLVRRLKTARRQGADVSLLEAQERALREAVEILSDPIRRRRYDAFRKSRDAGDPPGDASELWARYRAALMDPVTIAALDVIHGLTDLPIGDVIPKQRLAAPRTATPRTATPRTATPRTATPRTATPRTATPRVVGARTAEVTASSATSTASVRTVTEGVTDIGGEEEVTQPLDVQPPPMPRPSIALPMPGEQKRREQVDFEVPLMPSPPPEPEEETVEMLRDRLGSGGAFLRAVREQQGLSLEALAHTLNISIRNLTALEDDAFDRLPPRTYVQGYLKSIAEELELDAGEVARGYLTLFEARRG